MKSMKIRLCKPCRAVQNFGPTPRLECGRFVRVATKQFKNPSMGDSYMTCHLQGLIDMFVKYCVWAV
jgi:hypothetical protein